MNHVSITNLIKKQSRASKSIPVLLSALFMTLTLLMPHPTQAATLIPIVFNNGGGVLSPSLQLDSDGIPVLSYIDNFSNLLPSLLYCNSATYCDNPSMAVLDSVPARYTSLALDANNIPHISYYDLLNKNLKFARCEPADCSSPSLVTVDNIFNAGEYSSLVLTSSDVPVIAYINSAATQLKIAFCGDNECNSHTIKVLASDAFWGSVLKLDQAGNPVIAYITASRNLKLAYCDDPTCTSVTFRVLENVVQADSPSMQIDSTNMPVVAYYDYVNQNLKLARCTSAVCATSNSIVLDSSGDVGSFPSLALDTNDLAVITYYDHTNGDLDVAYCNDLACSAPDISVFDFPAGTNRMESALVMNGDVPIYAFYDEADDSAILLYNEFNNAPIVDKNASVKVAVDASLVLNPTVLNSIDVDNVGSPDTITYTVTAPPTEGILNQTTFTQNQLDSGNVSYTYTGVISDQFTFTLSDGTDSSGPYTFSINPSVANASPRQNYFTINTPTLTWSPVTYATEYEIEVGTASTITLANRVYTTIVPTGTPSVTLPALLNLPDGVYYWHVHARNGAQPWSQWTVTQSFTINT